MSDLISRQTAIDAWKEDFKGFINSLDMPRDDYKGIMEYIDEVPSASPWIPCSERLPEQDHMTPGYVDYSNHLLITVRNKDDGETLVDVGILADEKWYSNTLNGFVPNHWEVIAWMEIPRPYGEKEELGL